MSGANIRDEMNRYLSFNRSAFDVGDSFSNFDALDYDKLHGLEALLRSIPNDTENSIHLIARLKNRRDAIIEIEKEMTDQESKRGSMSRSQRRSI